MRGSLMHDPCVYVVVGPCDRALKGFKVQITRTIHLNDVMITIIMNKVLDFPSVRYFTVSPDIQRT